MLANLIKNAASKERDLSYVPKSVLTCLCFGLAFQIVLHATRPDPLALAASLPAPVANHYLQVTSFGEPVTLSKITMLWLQAFDNQPGISVPFDNLNYDNVIAWLDTILLLDPRGHYPLLSARIYAEVPNDNKKRSMLDFIYKKFLQRPNERWAWMAHAVFVAKHKLHDLDLALNYARELRAYTSVDKVPGWARQLELFVLEELGELEAAQIILGGLIESGEITDQHEIEFLMSRLK